MPDVGILSGYAERGGQTVQTLGATSTTTVQKSYPNATITVYDVNGVLATIYNDYNTSPTPKANPFTSDSSGYWFFYAECGLYIVQFSSGTSPNSIPVPFSRTMEIFEICGVTPPDMNCCLLLNTDVGMEDHEVMLNTRPDGVDGFCIELNSCATV